MIDHTGVNISNFARSKAFYAAALAPLGYSVLMEFGDAAGFGVAPKPDFWIGQGTPNVPPVHVAFRAETRAQVDAFHRAALAAGGKDNGAPGLRPNYHANYYGAFVLDPDGHNIEAVCHAPQ
jgi:catechol 2,3-dioxygenase-like lactoylglutathione lyase family enzyme